MSFLANEGAARHTRIKLCGMTLSEDVQLAAVLDVDAIGLIFAPRSQRRIDLDRAIALRDAAKSSLHVVALMMDNSADEVVAAAEAADRAASMPYPVSKRDELIKRRTRALLVAHARLLSF